MQKVTLVYIDKTSGERFYHVLNVSLRLKRFNVLICSQTFYTYALSYSGFCFQFFSPGIFCSWYVW